MKTAYYLLITTFDDSHNHLKSSNGLYQMSLVGGYNDRFTGLKENRVLINYQFCMALYNLYKGVERDGLFSQPPSPLSNDITLILPVVFLSIVLITTELGIYSIISTAM